MISTSESSGPKKSTLCFTKALTSSQSELTKDMTAIRHGGIYHEISQDAETCWKWYVLWEIEFDPHTGCTSVRPSPAAWHALVLLPKRDECRRMQVLQTWSHKWFQWFLMVLDMFWTSVQTSSSACLHIWSCMSHVFFPSNHVLVAFVQGLHSLCHGWVMKDTQKTIGDFGTLNEVPSNTHHHPNIHGEAHSWIKFGKGLTFSLQRSNKIHGLFCCMTSVTSRISNWSVTYYKNHQMTRWHWFYQPFKVGKESSQLSFLLRSCTEQASCCHPLAARCHGQIVNHWP